MFDRHALMIANMTYPAVSLSTISAHVCETFFQPSMAAEVALDFVLLHGTADQVERIQRQLARRDGLVVCVERMQPEDADVPLERLMTERALSINTATAGGNTSLMWIG